MMKSIKRKVEQAKTARIAMNILMIVDIIVVAFFGYIVLNVIQSFASGSGHLVGGQRLEAVGQFLTGGILLLCAILFGIGVTFAEKLVHMDNKRWNDYLVLTLIILAGVVAAGVRYIDMQKLTIINAREYLANENKTYKTYMDMLKNGYGGDDQKAIAAMYQMEQEHINSQAAAGGSWRWFYEITIACILSLLVNACFGIAVARHYRLIDELEAAGINIDDYESAPSSPAKPSPESILNSPGPAIEGMYAAPNGGLVIPTQPYQAKPIEHFQDEKIYGGFKMQPGFFSPGQVRAEDKQNDIPSSPTPVANQKKQILYLDSSAKARQAKQRKYEAARKNIREWLIRDPGASPVEISTGLQLKYDFVAKVCREIRNS